MSEPLHTSNEPPFDEEVIKKQILGELREIDWQPSKGEWQHQSRFSTGQEFMKIFQCLLISTRDI